MSTSLPDHAIVALRADRIRRLMEAAGELASRAALVEPLASSSGLSTEGVRYAFEHSLESLERLHMDALFGSVTPAERITIILSANVFLAPLRALVLGLAASDEVIAVPSSREPHFTETLVQAAKLPELTLARRVEIAALEKGEIHVYGRDETIRDIARQARVTVRGHGTGFGVARVDCTDDLVSAASRLARDVTLFDQRGCLSPRVVVLIGPPSLGDEFGEALHRALSELDISVPRGRLTSDEARETTTFLDTNAYVGRLWSSPGHAIGLMHSPTSLPVSPTGRHVQLVRLENEAHALALLSPLARFVTTVGAMSPTAAKALGISHARMADLGEMQSPPLDGPVDLR